MATAPKKVYAAGCVVWRLRGDEVQLLVIHRPKYDDWSFPKGKREKGESDLACALREVEEETEVRGELGPEFAPVRYTDHKGRPKVVRYWGLEASKTTDGKEDEFTPNNEVDKILWLRPAEASSMLTYSHDVDLIPQLLAEFG